MVERTTLFTLGATLVGYAHDHLVSVMDLGIKDEF